MSEENTLRHSEPAASKPIQMWSEHARHRKSVLLSVLRARLSMAGFRDRLILDSIPKGTPRILDVACGGGRPLLTYLADIVVGVEPEPSLASQARKSYFEVHQCRAQQLPFASDTFSVVVCTDALGHMKDKITVAKEMFRVMEPGAKLVITAETLSCSWLDTVGRSDLDLYQRNAIDRPDHRQLESAAATIDYFRQAGFSNIVAKPIQTLVHECGTVSAILDGYQTISALLRAYIALDRLLASNAVVKEFASLALTPFSFLNCFEPLANASMVAITATKP